MRTAIASIALTLAMFSVPATAQATNGASIVVWANDDVGMGTSDPARTSITYTSSRRGSP